MRYFRLLALFFKSNLLMELEYRANFVAQATLGVLWAGVTFASVTVFFTQTDTLGGWTYEQALVIVALSVLVEGAIQLLLQPNVDKIIQMVREGTMDFVLTKPVNSQFLATLRYARYSGLADMSAGVAIMLWALSRLGYTPEPLALAQFAVMLAASFIIVYSIWLVMATLSFWFVKIDNLTELFRSLFDTARFPVTTFSGWVRIALTFVLPVAFMTTFPAEAVLGKLSGATMIAAVTLAASLFAFSAWFWRRAVLNYSSASS
ncbi:ABC transporter permease [Candidatus Roseilinea sp. NK_OTU-006]|jgi:ABC-2 type transport system permease protein|nr:ABC-2 family transporter protein [Candidatus Roseilinea sp. NK_OTU-006]